MQSLIVPPDTTLDAARLQYAALRRLGPEARLEMGGRLSDSMRARLDAGVRHRHPDYDDGQVRLAVIRLLLGRELFEQCFPESNVVP